MKISFGLVHAFGSQDMNVKVISNEFVDECPGDSVVKLLFCLAIDVEHVGVQFHEKTQGFLVDVVVKLVPKHSLVVVEPFHAPFLLLFPQAHQFCDHHFRLALLLDERYYQPHNVRNDVSVLNLLHFELLFAAGAVWTIILVLGHRFKLCVFGRGFGPEFLRDGAGDI